MGCCARSPIVAQHANNRREAWKSSWVAAQSRASSPDGRSLREGEWVLGSLRTAMNGYGTRLQRWSPRQSLVRIKRRAVRWDELQCQMYKLDRKWTGRERISRQWSGYCPGGPSRAMSATSDSPGRYDKSRAHVPAGADLKLAKGPRRAGFSSS